MVCHACGKTVGDDDRFCTGCGTPLRSPATDQAPTPPSDGPVVGTPATVTATERDDGSPTAETVLTDSRSASGPATATPRPMASAQTVDQRTELLPLDDQDDWDASDPVWAATAPTPLVASSAPAVSTSDLPSTEPITEVWMESVPDAVDSPATPYDFVEREPVNATRVVPTATAQMPAVAPAADVPDRRFRFGAVTFLAVATGIVALVGLFATMLSVSSDTRLTIGEDAPFGFRTGTWIIDDLADNLSIAGLVAVVSMVAGGVAAAFGWRWGAGLAGGAGLGIAGLAALALGLAQIPIDAAHEFARIPPDEPFTLTITRDLGYWLLLVAGALGIVLFFASINDAIGDRRSGLNPWIAALGALATVVAATGPLLPENLAVFSDNWYLTDGPGEAPALLLATRLLQLGLLTMTGLIGFLSVRRWGLGVAIGGSLPIVWLAISTLFELTDAPVGPGFRNPGAEDMHLHGVTIIGVSAVAALSILAVIAAYDQGIRERH